MTKEEIEEQIQKLKSMAPVSELRDAAEAMERYAKDLRFYAADVARHLETTELSVEIPVRQPWERPERRNLKTPYELKTLILERHEKEWRRFTNAVEGAMQSSVVDAAVPPEPPPQAITEAAAAIAKFGSSAEGAAKSLNSIKDELQD